MSFHLSLYTGCNQTQIYIGIDKTSNVLRFPSALLKRAESDEKSVVLVVLTSELVFKFFQPISLGEKKKSGKKHREIINCGWNRAIISLLAQAVRNSNAESMPLAPSFSD